MLALVEGGEDALHRPHPGAEIANRQTDRNRRPVGLAGHVHDPAHALRDQVKAAASGRSSLTTSAPISARIIEQNDPAQSPTEIHGEALVTARTGFEEAGLCRDGGVARSLGRR